MTPPFSVRTTPLFGRLLRRLNKQHRTLAPTFEKALTILRIDPYNRSRTHDIKKLSGVRPGDGQYRLRLGRWRFRYDIWEREVELNYCGLRREETYR